MEYDDLILECCDGIATVTLNTPTKANALTARLKESLIKVMHDLARDDAVRVVILTGAGRTFSSGGDLDAMLARMEGKLEESRFELLRRIGDHAELYRKLDKPLIAAVNGAAVGGGFSLAMCCDIRIASEKARFGAVFVLRGMVPDTTLSYSLPRIVGVSKALELMFTGDIIDAQEAKALGIVSQVVPPEDLMSTARKLAARIAEQPPVAIELTKRLVYRSMIDDISRHLDWETYALRMCWQTEDFRERARAFLQKRS